MSFFKALCSCCKKSKNTKENKKQADGKVEVQGDSKMKVEDNHIDSIFSKDQELDKSKDRVPTKSKLENRKPRSSKELNQVVAQNLVELTKLKGKDDLDHQRAVSSFNVQSNTNRELMSASVNASMIDPSKNANIEVLDRSHGSIKEDKDSHRSHNTEEDKDKISELIHQKRDVKNAGSNKSGLNTFSFQNPDYSQNAGNIDQSEVDNDYYLSNENKYIYNSEKSRQVEESVYSRNNQLMMNVAYNESEKKEQNEIDKDKNELKNEIERLKAKK